MQGTQRLGCLPSTSTAVSCCVQLWDLRRKDAVVTCKGHKTGEARFADIKPLIKVLKLSTPVPSAAVLHAKFSPDGKWAASGSEDGEVKVSRR